jgi:hypothetical protein
MSKHGIKGTILQPARELIRLIETSDEFLFETVKLKT